MTKKLVERTSEPFVIGLSTGTFGKLREFVNGLDIPDCASLCTENDYEGYPEKLYFSYRSQETDEEYEARLKKEHHKQRRIEDDEKAMYKILKAKFEGE